MYLSLFYHSCRLSAISRKSKISKNYQLYLYSALQDLPPPNEPRPRGRGKADISHLFHKQNASAANRHNQQNSKQDHRSSVPSARNDPGNCRPGAQNPKRRGWLRGRRLYKTTPCRLQSFRFVIHTTYLLRKNRRRQNR
jgi:hypothetical protein